MLWSKKPSHATVPLMATYWCLGDLLPGGEEYSRPEPGPGRLDLSPRLPRYLRHQGDPQGWHSPRSQSRSRSASRPGYWVSLYASVKGTVGWDGLFAHFIMSTKVIWDLNFFWFWSRKKIRWDKLNFMSINVFSIYANFIFQYSALWRIGTLNGEKSNKNKHTVFCFIIEQHEKNFRSSLAILDRFY